MAKYNYDPRFEGCRVGGEICGTFGDFTQKDLAALYSLGHKAVSKIEEPKHIKAAKNEEGQTIEHEDTYRNIEPTHGGE